ncbi:MAG: MMPL family transporter [Gammaproteobacteria bacterium]|nr:MMPL family transporter [Gammaproteobacteria bacterium]
MNSLKRLGVSALSGWAGFVQQASVAVLVAIFALAFFAVRYTAANLSMNTDTEHMLSEELAWRKLDQEYEKHFPQYDNNILIVMEAATPDQAQDAAALLYERLEREQDLFEFVFYPNALALFRESGLLYLDTDELQDLSDNLAEVQPFLARLARDPSLRGLFGVLADALDAAEDGDRVDIDPVLARINAALEAVRDDRPYRLSWQELMSGDEPAETGPPGAGAGKPPHREFILTQPRLDYGGFFPATPSIETIHRIYDDLDIASSPGAHMRLTGATVLSHEEMLSVMKGTETAAVLALCLVTVILLAGLGSVKLALVTVISLVTGLALTAAFATLTVGELNLISVAFAVLYIGLGVDFAIHYCLRYREHLFDNDVAAEAALLRSRGADSAQTGVAPAQPARAKAGIVPAKAGTQSALMHTSTSIGGSLFLCAISTAIGFFSFIPTAYTGVAELGWISGFGMLISFVITLTVIPALLSLLPFKPGAPAGAVGGSRLVETHGGKILGGTAFLALASALLLTGLRFDHNPLNLHDQDGAALSTFRQLLADNDLTPWTAIMVAGDTAQADSYREQFARLDQVETVLSVADFIPVGQDEKLYIIDEMNLLLGDVSAPAQPGPETQTTGARLAALRAFREKLQESGRNDAVVAQLRANLAELLGDFDIAPAPDAVPAQAGTQSKGSRLGGESGDGGGSGNGGESGDGGGSGNGGESGNGGGSGDNSLAQLEQALLASLPGRLEALNASLNADYVSLDNLPDQLKRLWLSADGAYRIEIFPEQDMQDEAALREFVRAIQSVSPQVPGPPVINLEASDAVAAAFRQAFLYAFIAISFMLYILLGRKRDVLLVLTPLLTAAVITGGISVLAGIPLNFANVIALPLLLGIGVDSGIHIIHRFRTDLPDGKNILATSSARAVTVSSLTTMGGIGNLALSPHAGTASLGLLLTLGIGVTLVCMLLVLPALLTVVGKR